MNSSRKGFLKQIGIIFSLVILVSLLFPGGEALKYSYKINDVTREPIIAPYTFPILKTEKDYDEDKKAEKKSENNSDSKRRKKQKDNSEELLIV